MNNLNQQEKADLWLEGAKATCESVRSFRWAEANNPYLADRVADLERHPTDAPRDEPVDSHWVTRPYPMNPEYVVMTCTICPGYSTGRMTPGSSRLNEAVRQHDAAKHPVPRDEPGLAERVRIQAAVTETLTNAQVHGGKKAYVQTISPDLAALFARNTLRPSGRQHRAG